MLAVERRIQSRVEGRGRSPALRTRATLKCTTERRLGMTLSPRQELLEKYGDQLRAKISSKFSASTFLAGFAATILTTLVTDLWQQDAQMSLQYLLALGLASAATILFVHGIIRLDELSMPKRFWPSRPDVQNRADDVGLLTQDDLWALHDRMVFFWRYLTLAATVLTGLGLFALVLPPVHIPTSYFTEASFASTTRSAIAAFLYSRQLDARAPHRDKLIRPVD
jgi:hypothetical protein